MWQLSRESEVPGEVVETNSTLRPHEQQPGTQPPHWTRTPQFAVWMTRTPSCRRGKRGSLMWSGGSLGTLPSQRRSMQSACRQAQCRCGGQQIACPSHTKVFLISTRWALHGSCMRRHTCCIAYAMSGRVSVKYWREPVRLQYMVGSSTGAPSEADSLARESTGVDWHSAMPAFWRRSTTYCHWLRKSPSEERVMEILRKWSPGRAA